MQHRPTEKGMIAKHAARYQYFNARVEALSWSDCDE